MGCAVGARASRLRGVRAIGGGLFVRAGRSSSFVYAVRRGRVVAVGVATRALARDTRALRGAVKRLLAARATQTARRFEPAAAPEANRITGTTFAGSRDSRINEALAVLCGMKT